MYIDIGAEPTDTATINLNFNAAFAAERRWDIKVVQLECGNEGG